MMQGERTNRVRDVGLAVAAVVALVVTSLIGQTATYPNLVPWYASLAKPSFNPPNWVFAPVWTALYVLMAFALWRVLRRPSDMPGRAAALISFAAMLGLNAAWSWMFFGAHSPLLGLINIGPQLVVVLVTIRLVFRLEPLAAWSLVPLAAWVAFAGALNFAIWRLNA